MPIDKKTYIKIAKSLSEESKAQRKKVGCIIVKDDNIIAIGYNGTPSGFDNECEEYENGKLVTKKEVLHAESNAIAKCAKSVYSSKDADLYVTLSPCLECAKLIIQCGIKNVYYIEEYRDRSGLDLLIKAKVNVEALTI